jgi:hypothetical protein
MHWMARSIPILAIVGLLVLAIGRPILETRRARIIRISLSGLAFAMAALLLVLIIFFRPASCRALGGFWTPAGHCTGEFGGNGNKG